MPKQYDILIIGAGISGRALACALAQADLNIALLDPKPLTTTISDNIDLRTSAINLGSEQFFKELDAWETIKNLRVSPYRAMTIWDDEGEIHFDCSTVVTPYLGHIIENQVMLAGLAGKINQLPNITYLSESKPKALYHFHDSVQLLLDNGDQLQANLLVGADGADSWTRQAAGIGIKQHSYDQTAIVATVQIEKSHQQTAWQHFTPTGPLAFLPLQDAHQCSIVWSQHKQEADKLLALSDGNFAKAMSVAFENRLGKVTLLSKRKHFPLVMRHAESYVSERVALVADAIHTVHPLAGLGLNLGLMDVQCLGRLIADRVQQRREYWHERTLLQYQRARRLPNLSVLWAMRGFKQFFSYEDASLKWLRNEGLKLTNRAQPVKNLIMQSANYLY